MRLDLTIVFKKRGDTIMIKKITLLLICITLAGTVSVFAGDQTVFDEHPNALGYAGGANAPNVGGRGILFQKWFGSFGLQIAGMANNNTSDSSLVYNAGAIGLFNLYNADFLDWLSGQIYLFGGVSVSKYEELSYNEGSSVYSTVNALEFGGGIGFETVFARHLSAYVEIIESYNVNTGKLGFGPQYGFRFRF